MATKKDFTDRFLRSIKPAEPGKRTIDMDAAVPQFGIRVSDKSTKDNIGAFVLVARFPDSANPAPRRIGDYPAMPLAEARDIARDWRDSIARGIDPKNEMEAERREEQRRRADTFAAVFEKFAEDHLRSLRTGDQFKAAIGKHAMPHWRDRPIHEIRRADVNELVRAIRKTAPISANRVLANIKKFFAWCVDQDLLELSPAISVKRPSKEIQRDRVLSDTEIAVIWRACEGMGVFGRAFQFMLTTGQRRSEVSGMTWAELDLKKRVWTLSRERTKADRAHEVPLSDLAVSILEQCPRLGEYVFTTNGKTAISGWSKAKLALDKLAAEQAKAIASEHGEDEPATIADWRLHDLRRTCATGLARLEVERTTISKRFSIMRRAASPRIYDRFSYADQKRRALDLWAERLGRIADGLESGNVVALQRG